MGRRGWSKSRKTMKVATASLAAVSNPLFHAKQHKHHLSHAKNKKATGGNLRIRPIIDVAQCDDALSQGYEMRHPH